MPSRSGQRSLLGSRPAPIPTQPTATIWNGSQGPNPPTNMPDANVPIAPSTKPKPGPNELPATSTTMNIAENPATKPGSRRRHHRRAEHAYRVQRSSGPCRRGPARRTTAFPRHASRPTMIQGASTPCAVSPPTAAGRRNGHRNATSPIRFAATRRVSRRFDLLVLERSVDAFRRADGRFWAGGRTPKSRFSFLETVCISAPALVEARAPPALQ